MLYLLYIYTLSIWIQASSFLFCCLTIIKDFVFQISLIFDSKGIVDAFFFVFLFIFQ